MKDDPLDGTPPGLTYAHAGVNILSGGILRAAVLPDRGGETGFIDRISAYAALPDNLKQRIEGLRVIHRFLADATQARFGDRPDKCLGLSRNISLALEHPSVKQLVTHPLVYTQTET